MVSTGGWLQNLPGDQNLGAQILANSIQWRSICKSPMCILLHILGMVSRLLVMPNTPLEMLRAALLTWQIQVLIFGTFWNVLSRLLVESAQGTCEPGGLTAFLTGRGWGATMWATWSGTKPQHSVLRKIGSHRRETQVLDRSAEVNASDPYSDLHASVH